MIIGRELLPVVKVSAKSQILGPIRHSNVFCDSSVVVVLWWHRWRRDPIVDSRLVVLGPVSQLSFVEGSSAAVAVLPSPTITGCRLQHGSLGGPRRWLCSLETWLWSARAGFTMDNDWPGRDVVGSIVAN